MRISVESMHYSDSRVGLSFGSIHWNRHILCLASGLTFDMALTVGVKPSNLMLYYCLIECRKIWFHCCGIRISLFVKLGSDDCDLCDTLSEPGLHPICLFSAKTTIFSFEDKYFCRCSKSFSHLFANLVIIFHYVMHKKLRIQEYININLIDFKLKFICSLQSLYANCGQNIRLIYDRKDHSSRQWQPTTRSNAIQ